LAAGGLWPSAPAVAHLPKLGDDVARVALVQFGKPILRRDGAQDDGILPAMKSAFLAQAVRDRFVEP